MARRYGLHGMPTPPVISPASRCALGTALMRAGSSTIASGASPWTNAADVIIAYPFVLETATTFYKVWWLNGSAAGGTSDVAIFDENYTFIVGTGAATVGSGNSVPQSVALTATTKLPPGLYYAGMSHGATTTNQVFRWSVATVGAGLWQSLGCWNATDAPAIDAGTKTPGDVANIGFPVFGLVTRTGFDL